MSFADHGIKVRAQSGEESTTCPQCSADRSVKNKRHPCLRVNHDKGVWFCHNCGWTGSEQDKYDKASYEPYKPPPLKDTPTSRFRSIDEDVLDALQITIDENGTVSFPYLVDGAVVNTKTRTTEKGFTLTTGGKLVAYNYDGAIEAHQEDKPLIITEGEIDCLTYITAFDDYNCISVPNGAPNPGTKNFGKCFEWMDNSVPLFEKYQQFVLAVDDDPPGRVLLKELARRLGEANCKFVVYPEGCKDLNDVLVRFGNQSVLDVTQGAKEFPISGLYQVTDVNVGIDDMYKYGVEKGASVGYPSLDKYYTVKTGYWTVITGVPGAGKSSFVDQIIHNLTVVEGWRVAVCSPENQPLETHYSHLIQLHSRKPFHDMPFRKGVNQEDLDAGKQWAQDKIKMIMPDEKDFTIESVLTTATQAIKKYGVRALVIDPWNEFVHDHPDQTETEYISEAISRIRRFARKHDIHVFVVVHPRKIEKMPGKDYPVVSPYDIAGSSTWWSKADSILSLWRSQLAPDGITDIHIQKIKPKYAGMQGMVQLKHDYITGCYFEMEDEDA